MLMRRAPQPIIACVHGAACGGGFALALGADVRLAGESARMNAAFIRIGLSACDVGVSYFLPRMVGASIAAELLLTGNFIEAARAERLGLVSRVVPDAELDAAAQALADDMLRNSPLGLRLTKECLNASLDAGSLEQVIAMEDRNQILCSRSEDFREGIDAFLSEAAADLYAIAERGRHARVASGASRRRASRARHPLIRPVTPCLTATVPASPRANTSPPSGQVATARRRLPARRSWAFAGMIDEPHLDLALDGLAVGLAREGAAVVDGRDGGRLLAHRRLHPEVPERHDGDDEQCEDDGDGAEAALVAPTALRRARRSTICAAHLTCRSC